MKFALQSAVLLVACAIADLAHAGFVLEKPMPGASAPAPAERQVAPAKPDAAAPVSPVVTQSAVVPVKADQPVQGSGEFMEEGTPLTNRIRQVGEAPKSVEIRQGMGRQVRSGDAIAQILPPGWRFNRTPGTRVDQLIDWKGGRPWTVVLHGILADADLKARVDWSRKSVVVGSGSTPTTIGTPVPTVFTDVARKPDPVPAAPAQPMASPAPAQAAKPAKPESAAALVTSPVVRDSSGSLTTTAGSWTLLADQTLRQNVRRWLSQAGWNLVWSARLGDMTIDYPIDARVDLEGELIGAQGVLAKVILAYKDAEYPLEIEFFRGNKVAEVRLHRVPDGMDTANRKVGVNTPAAAPKPVETPVTKSPSTDSAL
ncbi:MAG: TcpQ domain-containing protein [Polaromonas sp.]|nr:TcpQ domain-containing protein [Polaromonas sp.]